VRAPPPPNRDQVGGHAYGCGGYVLASLALDGLLLRALPAVLFGGLMYPMVRPFLRLP
jgi:hypothetical protein